MWGICAWWASGVGVGTEVGVGEGEGGEGRLGVPGGKKKPALTLLSRHPSGRLAKKDLAWVQVKQTTSLFGKTAVACPPSTTTFADSRPHKSYTMSISTTSCCKGMSY